MFKLQYKIALSQFFVGCAIVVIGLTVHHQYVTKAAHKKAQRSLQHFSNNVALQVDLVLHEKADKIKALTGAPVIENLLMQSNAEYSSLLTPQRNKQIANLNQQWMRDAGEKAPFIQEMLTNSVAKYLLKQCDLNPDEYGEIFLTNRYGALVAATQKLTTFAHGHKYWWTASYNAGKGKTFFDDRGFDASVKGYVLGIVVPVKKDGQIIGILKSNIRIQKVLDEIVAGSSTECCQTLIVRDRGVVVLQLGHDALSTKVNPQIQTKLDALKAGSLVFDDGAVPSFAGFSPVTITNESAQFSFGGNPKSIDQWNGNQGEGWNVVTTDSTAHALQLFQQSNRYFYMVNILVVFVLAVLALYIGRRIANPLNAFSAAAKSIGAGEFNIQLPVSSHDELGEVAKTFNAMSENLKTTMATKEQYSLEIEQRKQTEQALQASKERLKEAQKIAKIGSWELDISTNNLVWSDEVYRMFNLEPQQFLATYESFLNNIHPEDRDDVNHAYLEAVKNRQPYNIVHRLLLADNTLKYVNNHCETFYDENDNPTRSVGTVQDVTETILAEQQHKKLEEQLRQKHKMEAVGYLAGGIAHNFNNNLGIILGNVEISQLKVQDPMIKELLKNAKIAILRSRDIVNQISTYSRNGEQNKNTIQLFAVINETITLLRSTLPTTINLQQIISPNCDLDTINANASQIQEVLINLCNNAVQAMDEQGDLTISLERVELTQGEIPAQFDGHPGIYVKLSVQDSGCGMPAELLDKIFDPFFTTKKMYEGTGMGLATVQGIIAQHGGIIKVNSTPNKGTVFNIYFPIVDEAVSQPTPINDDMPKGIVSQGKVIAENTK